MVEWHYNGKADITIGEVETSKTAKVILIVVISLIVIFVGLQIYFRQYIYDFIVNPEIILSANEVDVQVNSVFNPKEYIINENDGYEYEVLNLDSVNTNVVGTYKIIYKSHNTMKETEVPLTINVIDEDGPIIELTKEIVVLSLNDTKTFKPEDYVKSITDNYSKPENIKVEYPTNIDFTKTEIQAVYKAIDENGRVGTKVLNIVVVPSDADKEKEQERIDKQTEEHSTETYTESTEKPVEPATEKRTEKPTEKKTERATERKTEKPTERKTEKPTEKVTEKPTEKPTEPVTEKPTEAPVVEKPKIYGTKNLKIVRGSSWNDLMILVYSLDVACSDGTSVQANYGSVDLSLPGKYPVYWKSESGVTKTSYITVFSDE